MFTWVLGRCVASTVVIYYNPRLLGGALTASVDSSAEVKSAPSVASPALAESGGRCRKAMLGVCACPCKRGQYVGKCGKTEGRRRWRFGGRDWGGCGGGGMTDRVYRY